jgi:hypothetical protein
MTMWSRIQSWLRAIARRSRMENEMDAELRFHIEAFAEDLVRSGEPHNQARRDILNATAILNERQQGTLQMNVH